jgi:hypothetical protein
MTFTAPSSLCLSHHSDFVDYLLICYFQHQWPSSSLVAAGGLGRHDWLPGGLGLGPGGRHVCAGQGDGGEAEEGQPKGEAGVGKNTMPALRHSVWMPQKLRTAGQGAERLELGDEGLTNSTHPGQALQLIRV